jgi:23S rRNA (adenine2503-C2)-methyltransferase
MTMNTPHLLDLLPEEFISLFKERFTEPVYRAGQILDQYYALRAAEWEELTSAPKRLRSELAEAFSLDLPRIETKRVSTDGTVKYVMVFSDDVRVESVLIIDKDRRTVCFSTQAGCALGCAFCATGRGGFKRNLETFEIAGQVMAIERDLGARVSNCVAMGQGEPLLNLDATLKALRILNHTRCFGISARRLTLSTAGIAPVIRRLPELELPAKLAVSLHSARQEVREHLMPIAKQHPLPELKEALREFVDATRDRVTFEYILLGGLTDTPVDVRALIDFCRGLPVYVNLIPWNRVPGIAFEPSRPEDVSAFSRILTESGLEVAVRNEKGADIEAACGQLTQKCNSV